MSDHETEQQQAERAAEAEREAEAEQERQAELERQQAELDAQAAAEQAQQPDNDVNYETKAIGRANSAYIADVLEILGPDAGIEPCTHCMGLGFNSLELPADPHSHPCESCKGWGNVVTGSRVKGNETRICTDCKGAGYVPDQPEQAAPFIPPQAPAEPVHVEPLYVPQVPTVPVLT